jgi:hypothetical protein
MSDMQHTMHPAVWAGENGCYTVGLHIDNGSVWGTPNPFVGMCGQAYLRMSGKCLPGDAQVMAEAITVYAECKMTPRQLADRVRELEAQLSPHVDAPSPDADDENERTVDGVRYDFMATISTRCTGCSGMYDDHLCDLLGKCAAQERKDGRNGIWRAVQ